MSWLRNQWLFRGPFGDVEIELDPRSVDAEAREESRSELAWIIYAFKYREPEARRVVLEIYAEMQGLPRSHLAQSPAFDFGSGSSRADALGERLLLAAQTGRLVARKRKLSPGLRIGAPRVEAKPVLGPQPGEDGGTTSTSWVGLVLVDQNGAPVPGARYRVVASDGAVHDGNLDDPGTATLANIAPGTCQISCPYSEPRPAETYVVQPGEHLSGISAAHGFDDYTVVWNRPENAGLRAERLDPHVLQPGDSLYIPELKSTAARKPAGAQHQFTVRRSPLKLRLKLFDLGAKALMGAPVIVAGATLSTNGSGIVEAAVDKSVHDVPLSTASDQLDLDVGALNEKDDDTDAGWKARLYNLGYLWDPAAAEGDDELAFALQDFQAQYGMTVNGQADDATKAKLQQVYGG
jgi:hypothetical protein